MTLLSPLLLTLLFAAGVFAFLLLLSSHLRYRRSVLDARAAAEKDGVDPAGAEILLVEASEWKAPFALLWLRAEKSLLTHRDEIQHLLRRKDQIIPLRDGGLLLLIRTEPQHLRAVGDRLCVWLLAQGFSSAKAQALRDSSELGRDLPEAPLSPPPSDPVIAAGQEHLLDPLTGVLSPERCPLAVRKLLATERRRNQPLCLVRMDVDGMGELNALRGREAGDALLQGMAQRLMSHCRETDLIGRLGDDEFLLCLPGLPAEGMEALRRMVAAIKQEAFPVAGGMDIRATVCAGLAGAPAHGQSPGALFDAAGLALTAAKQRGRSVCMSWEPAMRHRPNAGQPPAETRDVF